jgi:hypothetical protein
MFPVCIQYFDPLKGVQNKLLDFVESAEETSMAITDLVLQSLEKHNLDVNYVPSVPSGSRIDSARLSAHPPLLLPPLPPDFPFTSKPLRGEQAD